MSRLVIVSADYKLNHIYWWIWPKLTTMCHLPHRLSPVTPQPRLASALFDSHAGWASLVCFKEPSPSVFRSAAFPLFYTYARTHEIKLRDLRERRWSARSKWGLIVCMIVHVFFKSKGRSVSIYTYPVHAPRRTFSFYINPTHMHTPRQYWSFGVVRGQAAGRRPEW